MLVVSLLTAPVATQAQVTLGLGGGIVSSTLVGDATDGIDVESETGFSFGAWLSFPFGERFSFVPGAHWVQKGASFTDPVEGSGTFDLTYFELPLLAAVSLTPPDAPVGFNIFAGPSIALEVGCTLSSGSTEEDCEDAEADERQTTDIGAVVGAGAQFPFSDRMAFSVSAGIDLGLRKLDTSADPDDLKNRAFFGTVAVVIPIGN